MAVGAVLQMLWGRRVQCMPAASGGSLRRLEPGSHFPASGRACQLGFVDIAASATSLSPPTSNPQCRSSVQAAAGGRCGAGQASQQCCRGIHCSRGPARRGWRRSQRQRQGAAAGGRAAAGPAAAGCARGAVVLRCLACLAWLDARWGPAFHPVHLPQYPTAVLCCMPAASICCRDEWHRLPAAGGASGHWGRGCGAAGGAAARLWWGARAAR